MWAKRAGPAPGLCGPISLEVCDSGAGRDYMEDEEDFVISITDKMGAEEFSMFSLSSGGGVFLPPFARYRPRLQLTGLDY